MSALILDCDIPSYQDTVTKGVLPKQGSGDMDLNVNNGSCEAGDLQELNGRSEFRESTEGWPVRCQWGQGQSLLYKCKDQS